MRDRDTFQILVRI